MTEYFEMSDATERAFRGGWFHTGDSARLDADGNLFFASRAKEVIRRRGENIAATDVEAAIDAHHDVQESAAVGVPSELSEDDIKVFVVRATGQPPHTRGRPRPLRQRASEVHGAALRRDRRRAAQDAHREDREGAPRSESARFSDLGRDVAHSTRA